MAITQNSYPDVSQTSSTAMTAEARYGIIKIDHNHPIYFHPNDTPGSSFISIQLNGYENYVLWSRSMDLSLVGRNKVGFVDGCYPKTPFDASLNN